MTNYYPLLRKAVGALGRSDVDGRYALYDRARETLLRHALNADPPWTAAEMDAQMEALRTATERIEDEFATKETASSSPQSLVRGDRAAPTQTLRADDTGGSRRWATLAVGGAAALLLVAGLAAFTVHYFGEGGMRQPEPRQAALAPPPSPAKPAQPEAGGQPADSAASFVLRRQRVFYRSTHPVGTIVISRAQRFLYLVQPDQVAIRYTIGVGPECENVVGLFRISEKRDNPGSGGLTPSSSAGSAPANPEAYGPRAFYFGSGRAVHGTSEPRSIGQAASFGCFHSWNSDIVELYERVILNERVVVSN